MIRRTRLLSMVIIVGGLLGMRDQASSRTLSLCHNCIEDSGHTKHSCARAECEGGDNCFEGCDHTTTVTGGCFTSHEFCPAFLASNDDVITAIARNDAVGLRKLLREHPAAAAYNNDRASVQLFDCNHRVIDNLIVSTELATELDN